MKILPEGVLEKWKWLKGVLQSRINSISGWIGTKLQKFKRRFERMIGPLEKGMEAAALVTPAQGEYEGVDLKVLPKYISFRAALLKSQLTQQYTILILMAVLVIQFIVTRYETYSLYGKLREKEYILAPGVQDFTPANPHTVPDGYIDQAVEDFLGKLGNISPSNIDHQYESISQLMAPELKVRFSNESLDFRNKVKAEGITETLSLTQKEIQPNGEGFFHVVATGRRDTFINNEYVGHTSEAIEMVLQLVAPKRDRPWYIQINSLSRESADTFRSKQDLRK